MPLQATSGAASYDAFGGGVAAVPNYIEDVFGTFLYTGNGSTQTITNGIDLSTKGGLVWLKSRSQVASHGLFDTLRGANNQLLSDSTAAAQAVSSRLDAFTSSGFTLGSYGSLNGSGSTYASWTFRKQPKFFDVVTYTGNGTVKTVNHNLGSVPGVMIVKCTSAAGENWAVYHRSLGATKYIELNNTNAASTSVGSRWDAEPTSTSFSVGYNGSVNSSGATYIAYLFAHNAGGFGLTGTDNVISCGSVAATGGVNNVVNLGYEPQLVIIKSATVANSWHIIDNMRGFTANNGVAHLFPNSSTTESVTTVQDVGLTATGFTIDPDLNGFNGTGTYIYIAIRRGPMKVPTSGTSVFNPNTSTGTITTGFPVDTMISAYRGGDTNNFNFVDRLRGFPANNADTTNNRYIVSSSAVAETTTTTYTYGWTNTQYKVGLYGDNLFYSLGRAPSTFDEVCWIGDGNNPRSLNHNLAVAPELIITKKRNSTSNWITGFDFASTTYKYFYLNDTGAATSDTYASSPVYGGQPTASVFVVGNQGNMNISGDTYVTYMWATNAGVTKVGSYTGNGSSQTINCGFTGGSRFVLIKRTNSSGDWYVWDSARGIVSGNDPHLSLNTTAAEVTTDDTIDTDSTGFIVNQVSATNCNVNGASYIFLSYA